MQAPVVVMLVVSLTLPGPAAASATSYPTCTSVPISSMVVGDVSWYDPPSAYDVSWSTVMGNFEDWGRLHGLTYDPTHPYCAMRDFPTGSFVEIQWGGNTTTCYVVDYGPNGSVFPERVLDAAVEVFERLAPRDSGVLRNATVTLLNTDHCGRAPAPATGAMAAPVTSAAQPRNMVLAPPRHGWGGRVLCWPI